MAIPEQQLSAWSGLGAQQGSAATYNSIKAALASHAWPDGMDHNVYLQGSYANHTNIRGDSDVDVVVESENVFYHNVPSHLRQQYGLTGYALYGWTQFRTEVSNALVNYYGLVNVTDGNKCLKVAGGGNRLNADVVPCNAYRNYYDGPRYAEGITFWTRSGTQIVNFPKLHREHGTRKNEACSTHYKPNVRVFKNARNRCNNSFPSYFLECLLFNVPDSRFEAAFASTFFRVVQYLVDAKNAGTLANFVCQNGQQTLFGPALHQVDLASGWRIVDDLANLWNRWP